MHRYVLRRCFTTIPGRSLPPAAAAASAAAGRAAQCRPPQGQTAAAETSDPTPAPRPPRYQCAQLLSTPRHGWEDGQEEVAGTCDGDGDSDGNGNDNAASLEGQEITLLGSVKSIRKQKRVAFAQITDGTCAETVQAVIAPSPQVEEVTAGSAVSVTGTWARCPAGKQQTHELHVRALRVLGASDPASYPVQKKYHTPEFLRGLPHLRLRTPQHALLARFRAEALAAVAAAFAAPPPAGGGGGEGSPPPAFFQVHTPLITAGDCEGAGETFALATRSEARATTTTTTGGQGGTSSSSSIPGSSFFRSPRYLTVSAQLHLEAFAAALGNVWTLSPTFRAERSDTPRHLAEFYMLEAEVQFLPGGLDELLDQTEALVRDITARLARSRAAREVLAARRSGEAGEDGTAGAEDDLQRRWDGILSPAGPWPRVTYSQAIDVLQRAVAEGEAAFRFPPTWGHALQFEHEKFLVAKVGQAGQAEAATPVFVTHYPRACKPFYMLPSSLEEGYAAGPRATVAAFDLLLPGVGEIVGGSLREHRLPHLVRSMREHGLLRGAGDTVAGNGNDSTAEPPSYPHLLPGESLGALQWYADLRRWGGAPHGGWGLGFDRFLGYLAGVGNLRDVVAFPRYAGRADC